MASTTISRAFFQSCSERVDAFSAAERAAATASSPSSGCGMRSIAAAAAALLGAASGAEAAAGSPSETASMTVPAVAGRRGGAGGRTPPRPAAPSCGAGWPRGRPKPPRPAEERPAWATLNSTSSSVQASRAATRAAHAASAAAGSATGLTPSHFGSTTTGLVISSAGAVKVSTRPLSSSLKTMMDPLLETDPVPRRTFM
mmetsp:Transcript_25439/g.95869  ORF Transcript_25439/g.95869 Transcript_25439/m.95869 type:complete len:200 (+) Transcript_25439:1537-2136(+)